MNADGVNSFVIAGHGNLEIALDSLDCGMSLTITMNAMLELPASDLELLKEIL